MGNIRPDRKGLLITRCPFFIFMGKPKDINRLGPGKSFPMGSPHIRKP